MLALPVLAGGEDGSADGVTLGPGAAELLDRSELDLFAVLEHARATGKAGEVTALPVAGAGGAGRHATCGWCCSWAWAPVRRRSCAGPGPRSRVVPRTSTPWPPRCRPSATTPACARSSRARCSARSSTTCAPADPRRGRYAGSCIAGGTFAPEVLRRGLAVAMAGWRSRTLATVPSNTKNPQWFVDQARPHRPAGRPEHDRARRAGARGAGVRRHHRGRPGLVHPAAAAPARVHPRLRQARCPARGDRRQGDHLRQWRPLDQDRRGDGQHEARHERRRRRARRAGRARRRRLPGPRDRPRGAGGERDLRQRDAPR